MEMVEAPRSTTRAVGLPDAKLWLVSSGIWAPGVEDKRSQDTVSGKPEGGTPPVLHGYFYALFPIFTCVPAGFGHE